MKLLTLLLFLSVLLLVSCKETQDSAEKQDAASTAGTPDRTRADTAPKRLRDAIGNEAPRTAEADGPFSPFSLIDEADPALLEIPREGAERPLVVVIEAGAYQCEHTRKFEPIITSILSQQVDAARFFVHNPLPGHKKGYLLAVAASAAQRQGRFWEFHRQLMKSGPDVDEDRLLAMARRVGLDVPMFLKDLKREEVKEHVERNRTLVAALGLTGTPVFIVNGKLVLGRIEAEKFAGLVQSELDTARKLAEKTPSLEKLHLAVARVFRPYETVMKKGVKWGETREEATSFGPWTRFKVPGGSHAASLGPEHAPVTIVEYIDLTCPHSARAWRQAKELAQKYEHDVRFEFKLNPTERTPEAMAAARAAFGAGKMGRFVQFAGAFFRHGDAESAAAAACEQGFVDCPLPAGNDPEFAEAVERVKFEAPLVAAIGTPVYFVNGLRRPGFVETDRLVKLIDDELSMTKALVAKGMKVETVYAYLTARGATATLLAPVVQPTPVDDPLGFGADGVETRAQLMVFWNYRSAFCRNLWTHLARVLAREDGSASVYLKPLAPDGDPFSRLMSVAVICAAEMGMLKAMHLKLLEMKEPTMDKVVSEAAGMGLNADKFRTCLGGESAHQSVDDFMIQARKADVTGTPAVFINGRRLTVPTGIDYYSIMAAILSL